MTLSDFALELGRLTTRVHEESHHALERAAKVVEKEAKASIGEYQTKAGQFVAWAPLADSTVADKERLGYAPPDNPELRTGTMRESIEHTVKMESFDGVAYIGSDSKIMEWQELGTSKMPPRSILGGAAVRKADDVAKLVGGSVYGALVGGGVYGGRLPIPGLDVE